MAGAKRRAIGITRVSVEGDRQEDRLYSYDIQAAAIAASCDASGLDLLWVGKERAVSGGASLANRGELDRAVSAVEAGEADVILTAYFDRFFRNLAVQAEVIGRIERAGGELLALDHGKLTNGTAAEVLQANVMGSVSQFYRQQAGEKSRAGQAEAVRRGRVPWSRVPLGYVKGPEGRLEVDEAAADLVRACYRMRLDRASYMTIRAMLAEHGITRSPRAVEQMLGSRTYLGEIHFGDLVNREAHPAIVDPGTFDRVQRLKVPRGPQPKSDRLLSRLRVLRCGSCGSPLGTMKMPRQGDYPIYRCGSHNDCSAHVTVAAEIVDDWVWERVKAHLADERGSARAGENADRLADARDEAQAKLDRAVRAFAGAGLADEPSAAETLDDLRAERDALQRELDALPATAGVTVAVDDDLPLAVRRDLVRATVRRVAVAPSGRGLPRGADRLSLEFF